MGHPAAAVAVVFDVDALVRLGWVLAEFGIDRGWGYPPVYIHGFVDVVEVRGGLGTFFRCEVLEKADSRAVSLRAIS